MAVAVALAVAVAEAEAEAVAVADCKWQAIKMFAIGGKRCKRGKAKNKGKKQQKWKRK